MEVNTIEDKEIVELFLKRDESAIEQVQLKYGQRLKKIAYEITEDFQTAEECENDTYLKTWESIPPHTPYDYLYPFLVHINRNVALNYCRYRNSKKRKVSTMELSTELEQILPGMNDIEEWIDDLLDGTFDISPNIELNAGFSLSIHRDQENNAILTWRMIEATRSRDDKISALQMEENEMEKESVVIGTFQVPQNMTTLKNVELDVSQSVLVKRVIVSGMTMQMTFDDAYANEQFEKQLKESGEWDQPDFDLEEHGYSFYDKELSLVMKDGTKHVIWRADGNYDEKFAVNGFGTGNDGTGLVDEVIGFAEFIDVDEIDYLQMDDEIFKLQETK
ncbi:MAG: sigma factor [Eubacteriales bacterium]|nr:sigma factor [Eubacteriales bacterium]